MVINPDAYDFKWGVDKEKQKSLMDEAFVMISDKIACGDYVPELFKNTKKIIKKLYDERHILSICTSREKDATINILEYYDIKKYFTCFRTREDIKLLGKKAKPDPELILEIIEELNFDKKNVFMIGDTDADIKGGQNAGIKTIGVSWGYFTKEQLIKCGADIIIEDFLEIK
jgi:phosphoglycolate phosphatase